MSESVNVLIFDKGDSFKLGDVYVLNNFYNGGIYLLDIIVIIFVFLILEKLKKFFVIVK